MSRNLDLLVPELKEKCEKHIELCKQAGHEIIVTSTSRSLAEQIALYIRGRAPLETVNTINSKLGISPITEQQNNRITWTLNSLHVVDEHHPLSRAYDIALIKDGKAVWDVRVDIDEDKVSDYDEVGQIGESLGLIWGKSFGDIPHFQLGKA
jgi:hypothetical protein